MSGVSQLVSKSICLSTFLPVSVAKPTGTFVQILAEAGKVDFLWSKNIKEGKVDMYIKAVHLWLQKEPGSILFESLQAVTTVPSSGRKMDGKGTVWVSRIGKTPSVWADFCVWRAAMWKKAGSRLGGSLGGNFEDNLGKAAWEGWRKSLLLDGKWVFALEKNHVRLRFIQFRGTHKFRSHLTVNTHFMH